MRGRRSAQSFFTIREGYDEYALLKEMFVNFNVFELGMESYCSLKCCLVEYMLVLLMLILVV